MLINDLNYFKNSANYFNITSGIDHPDECQEKLWWYTYLVQDFEYQFNSWGFRGPEYDQHIGKPVNICLGDSFTVNLGGPIEHSWCSQLAEQFDIPTINLSMDGAGNDAIRLVYNRACEIFDVQNTFVMYSFFHRRLQNKKFIQIVEEDSVNFEYFLTQRIQNVYEAALPNRVWLKSEQDFLDELGIFRFEEPQQYYLDHKDTVDRNRKLYILESSYNSLLGSEWPKYKNFIKGAEPHPDMLTREFGAFLIDQAFFVNRDGFHLNQETNKIYADYFYNQWKQHNES